MSEETPITITGALWRDEPFRHIVTIDAECECGNEWTAHRDLPHGSGGIVRSVGYMTLICPECHAQQRFPNEVVK